MLRRRTRWQSNKRELVQFVPLLDGGDPFFQHAEAFFDMRQGAQTDFDGARPIVKSSEHLGLHVAHFLDKFVAEAVHVAAEFSDVTTKLRAEFVRITMEFCPELV